MMRLWRSLHSSQRRTLPARSAERPAPFLSRGATMQNTRSAAAGGHGRHSLRWVAYLLVISGGAAIGWCAAILTDTYIAQWRAREQLALMPPVTMSSPPFSSPRSSALPTPRSSVMVKAGTPLAELSIPRLGLSAVVLEGSDDHTLRVGLGHIETTSLPGESGNVAIAGHRDSFFRPLRNVQVGDDILLETPSARVHYRVSSYSVVNSSEVSVIDPTRDARLTLVTCFPFQFIGSAPDRFIVRADFVADGHVSPVQRSGSVVQRVGKGPSAGRQLCGLPGAERGQCRQPPAPRVDRPARPRFAQSAH
jgi:sortase A